MLSPKISCGSILIFWPLTAPANVKAKNSPASSATLYLQGGGSWMAKGEIEHAIADIPMKCLRRE